MSSNLHQHTLQHGNDDAATMEGKQLVMLHLVEGTADVKAAVVQFVCQLLHQHVEGLGSCGIETAGEEEADEAFTECLGYGTPGTVLQALAFCCQQVEQVQAEDELGFQQQKHFLFVDTDEVTGCSCLECRGVALRYAKKVLGLDDVRGIDCLDNATGIVVADGLALQGAIGEKEQLSTVITCLDDPFAGWHLGEPELGMCHHFHKVGMTHALKEGEL